MTKHYQIMNRKYCPNTALIFYPSVINVANINHLLVKRVLLFLAVFRLMLPRGLPPLSSNILLKLITAGSEVRRALLECKIFGCTCTVNGLACEADLFKLALRGAPKAKKKSNC